MEFRVLGDVQVVSDGRLPALGGPKQRLLLAVLLCHPGQLVPVDRLVEVLWAPQAPASAASNVRLYVHQLRRVLGAERVVARGRGYALAVVPAQIDSHQFTELAEEGRSALAAGALVQARAHLHDALAKWRGRPFADLADAAALQEEAARLEELRLSTLEHRIEADLRLGQHTAVVAELTALVAAHPFREGFHAQLMRALHLCGRRAEALNAYRNARTIFVRELGLEPGPELRQLEKVILTDGHDIHPPPGTRTADVASSAQHPSQSEKGTPAPTSGQTSAAPAKRGESAEHLDTPPPTPASPATTPYPVPAQLPRDVHGFTGRTSELAHLDTILATADERSAALVITALSGTAGVGKTALAVHWAHRVADRFPDGQLYVNLRAFDPSGSAMSAGEAIRGFLDAFQVPPQQLPVSLPAQIGLYRSLLAGRRVLVVLDNARDAEQIRPLLPGSPGCLVVVTSRNQLTGLIAAEGAHPLTLDLLTPDDAHQLLARRLGERRVAAEPQAAVEIISACARLPLALAIVAARAATHPHFPLDVLAAQLGDTRSLDPFNDEDATLDVRAVFSWSYRAISPESARLFRLLGMHPGPDFATAAVASLAGISADRVRRLLTELARAHLIAEYTPGRYTFHDLLRAYANELAHIHGSDEDRQVALHRLLDHYLHTAHAGALLLKPGRDSIALAPTPPGVQPEHLADYQQALAWFATERPILLAAVEHAASTGFDTHAWRLAWTFTYFFHRHRHWQDLLASQRTALHAALRAAQRLADQHGQAYAHRGLARAYIQLGRFDDASAHLCRALDVAGELGDRSGQADTHLGLAWMFGCQRRHREALRHAQVALTLFQDGGDRCGQADALSAVGWYHAQLGDYQHALAFCQQAVTLLQEVGDPYREATTWDSIGYAHHHLGHNEESAICYLHAAELFRDLGDRYKEAEALARLGDTYDAAGNLAAARDGWQHALRILEELGHPNADHLRTKLMSIAQTNQAAPEWQLDQS